MYKINSMFGDTGYSVISLKILEALLQKDLTDEDRAKIIAEGFSQLEARYPDLRNISTKKELSETELRLIKEIKEVDANLRKDMRNIEANLRKEIEAVRLEIKEVDANLRKEIEAVRLEVSNSKTDIIKWIVSMFFANIIAMGGLVLTAFKLFSSN